MLQPILAQFTSRGMPAADTARRSIDLAEALALPSPPPPIAFGDGAPEETLPQHLPELLEAAARPWPAARRSCC